MAIFCPRHSKKKQEKEKEEEEERPSYVLLWFRRWPNDDAQVRLEGRPLPDKHTMEKEKKEEEEEKRQLPTAGDNRPCIRCYCFVPVVGLGPKEPKKKKKKRLMVKKCWWASAKSKQSGGKKKKEKKKTEHL